MVIVKEELKTFVKDLLHGGPKRGIELVVALATHVHSLGETDDRFIDIVVFINDLVKEGEIVEVEYELPSMSYRAKSLYFPKGTTIRLV